MPQRINSNAGYVRWGSALQRWGSASQRRVEDKGLSFTLFVNFSLGNKKWIEVLCLYYL